MTTKPDLDTPDFWIGKEYGIITHDGQKIIPYFSVFVEGEAIKHKGLINNYPYPIALELAKDYPNASIKPVAYSQMFGEVEA